VRVVTLWQQMLSLTGGVLPPGEGGATVAIAKLLMGSRGTGLGACGILATSHPMCHVSRPPFWSAILPGVLWWAHMHQTSEQTRQSCEQSGSIGVKSQAWTAVHAAAAGVAAAASQGGRYHQDINLYLGDSEAAAAAPCKLALDLVDRFAILREAQGLHVRGLVPAPVDDYLRWLHRSIMPWCWPVNGLSWPRAMRVPSLASTTQTQQHSTLPPGQVPAAQWVLSWQACRHC
jgi:hypothetical protein